MGHVVGTITIRQHHVLGLDVAKRFGVLFDEVTNLVDRLQLLRLELRAVEPFSVGQHGRGQEERGSILLFDVDR